MNFATERQVEQFFSDVPHFEKMLVASGIKILKYWVSVSEQQQHLRFTNRLYDPLKQWKLSPMDLASRARWKNIQKRKKIC